VPLLTSAEKSAQCRRLPMKTIVQQIEADIRSFPLFLCLIICLHSALSETNFGRSVISFESLLYVRLATNVSAEKFSWRSDMWMPLYFRSIIVLYIEKKQLILFYKSKLFDYSKIKYIEYTFNVMLTYYTLILQYNFLVKL